MLIECISQDLGFTEGKPVAACVIYKCLLHWRSFEVERTTVFDRIIQTIASAVEVTQHFWNTCIDIHDVGAFAIHQFLKCPKYFTNTVLHH